MAIERNFTGFEFGDYGELQYGTGGILSGALNAIVNNGTARSGSFYHKVAAATNAGNLLSFPAGAIVGTSGTVTSGNHKRVSVRAYFRIESAGGNGQIRLFGFGNDAGTVTVQFGAQNTSGGFLQPGNKIGLRIGGQTHNAGAGAYPWGTVDLTVGVWYRLLLDVDLDVGATTTLNASVRVTEDSASPTVDFTVTNSANIGATDNLDKLALGYSNGAIGAFGRTATFNWDDIVYIATSDADAAAGQPTLPTQTHIYAVVPPTGEALNQWTGTHTAVDEYPLNIGDTMSSSTASAEVEFSHASGLALGYASIIAIKLYVNALVSGAGTGSVDYMLNGVAKNVTLIGNYPAFLSGVDPIGGILWTTLSSLAFAGTTFGIRKQNGTQSTVLGNIGIEVIGELASYGSGNQIRGETQIKVGSIYDAQISDSAAIKRHKIEGLGGGASPVFFPEEPVSDDWIVPGPPGSAASVRIPVVPVFFPEDGEDAMLMPASSSSSSGGGGGSVTNNNNFYGGEVLIAELTASGGASLDFVTRNISGQSGALFQSDFDEYLIEFIDVLPASATVQVLWRLSQDGGATYDATGIYDNVLNFSFGSTTGSARNATATSFYVRDTNTTLAANSAYNGRYVIARPLSNVFKTVLGQGSVFDNGLGPLNLDTLAYYKSTAAVNALRVLASSGNLSSGTVRIYGLTKTPATASATTSYGGPVLLNEQVASASASLSFATRNVAGQSGALFNTDYDEYVVELINVLPATDNVDLLMRYSTDGGASYVSAANYDYANLINNVANFSTPSVSATGATSSKIIPTQDNALANGGACGSLKVFAPLNAAQHKHVIGSVSWWNNDNQFYNGTLSFRFITTSAINAFQLLYSSGNIASGTVRVYGISKLPISQLVTPAHGLVLIGQQTVSGAAQIDFASRNVGSLSGAIFQSDYDEYVFELVNIITASATTLLARLSTDGGSTFDSAANYRYAYHFAGSGGGNGFVNSNTGVGLFVSGTTAAGGTSGMKGTLQLADPLSTTREKAALTRSAFKSGDGNYYHTHGATAWVSTSAANAIRFIAAAGNITGTIRCYGVVKDATYPVSTIQTGTHATRPTVGNAGRIYLPNDGFSIGRDSGTAWETFGPVFPFTPPPTGVWSWQNQGTATITEAKDSLTLYAPANGNTFDPRYREKVTPATPYVMTAYLRGGLINKNNHQWGVFLRQAGAGTGQNRLMSFFNGQAAASGTVPGLDIYVADQAGLTSNYGTFYRALNIMEPVRWFRIADNGTDITFSISTDGQNWVPILTQSRLTYLLQGPDRIGFYYHPSNAATPNIDGVVNVLSWKEA